MVYRGCTVSLSKLGVVDWTSLILDGAILERVGDPCLRTIILFLILIVTSDFLSRLTLFTLLQRIVPSQLHLFVAS